MLALLLLWLMVMLVDSSACRCFGCSCCSIWATVFIPYVHTGLRVCFISNYKPVHIVRSAHARPLAFALYMVLHRVTLCSNAEFSFIRCAALSNTFRYSIISTHDTRANAACLEYARKHISMQFGEQENVLHLIHSSDSKSAARRSRNRGRRRQSSDGEKLINAKSNIKPDDGSFLQCKKML